MNSIYIQYQKTQIGELILGAYDDRLCLLDFRYRKMRNTVDQRLKQGLNAKFIEAEDEIIDQTRQQLDEYLQQQRQQFDLPLLMVGSDFQKSVWQGLMGIPYGQTCSYLELAKNIGNEKAVRAVANANGANAIAVIIPCHRVIGSNGELTGYGGGLPAKKRLLAIERAAEPGKEMAETADLFASL